MIQSEDILSNLSARGAHPLNDEWLMSFAAGAASPGESILISTYLDMVPEARQAVADAATLGGALLAGLDDAEVPDDLWERLSQHLDETAAEGLEPMAGSAVRAPDHSRPQEYISRILDDDPHQDFWQYLGPGLRKAKVLETSTGETLWLLKAKPGANIPAHTHKGTELTLVLKGAFQDAYGYFSAGDVEEADDEVEHSLTIAGNEDCVCLALTQSPIILRHWSARLLQRLVGF